MAPCGRLAARCARPRPLSAAALVGVAAASLLFALHGSRPEAVAWVNGRLELMTALFFLAALVLYLRHCETTRVSLLAASLACFLIALLVSMPSVITISARFW